MSINFLPQSGPELKPRITVIGVGGAGGNAVNNMIASHLEGVEFIVANTDAQSLAQSRTDRRIQLGDNTTQGLGAGSRPDIGRAAAEETIEEILKQLGNSNMVFITAGMGGGTGTGAAPVIARAAREQGILTVGVVTKPFHFEGAHRMRTAEAGIAELQSFVDTLIIIPNQNLFRVATERTTFADAFKMADDVLHSGVRGVTDLMIMPGLINLDFADIRTVMSEMGKAMMGTGEAEGEKRAIDAAEAAISNPLLDDTSMKGARGVLINITGGPDMTLFEVDEAANRIRDEVDPDANIIFGSTFEPKLEGRMRVSVVATGIEAEAQVQPRPTLISLMDQQKSRAAQPAVERPAAPAPMATHMIHGNVALQAQPVAPAPMMDEPEPVVAMEPEPEFENLFVEEAVVEPVRVEAQTVRVEPQFRPEPQRTVAASAPMQQPRPAMTASEPARQAIPERRSLFGLMTGATRTPKQPAPMPVPSPQPQASAPSQPRLNTERDRASAKGDVDLDIPAFLRRQAN